MLNVIESIRMRLKRYVGCFGLYGYDLMIDEDMKVWLIEINVNPVLTTNINTLIQAIPPVVQQSVLVAIQCLEKIRHSQKLFPLKSLKGSRCISNELERKGSLPYIEQKRAAPFSPNKRKLPSAPALPPKINNSPPSSPKILSKITTTTTTTTEQTSVTQKSSVSNLSRLTQERSETYRSSDSLVSLLTTTNQSFPSVNIPSNETMVIGYQTTGCPISHETRKRKSNISAIL